MVVLECLHFEGALWNKRGVTEVSGKAPRLASGLRANNVAHI